MQRLIGLIIRRDLKVIPELRVWKQQPVNENWTQFRSMHTNKLMTLTMEIKKQTLCTLITLARVRKQWQCSCTYTITALKESVDSWEKWVWRQEEGGQSVGGGRRSVMAYLLNGRVMERLCDYEGESLINSANLLWR